MRSYFVVRIFFQFYFMDLERTNKNVIYYIVSRNVNKTFKEKKYQSDTSLRQLLRYYVLIVFVDMKNGTFSIILLSYTVCIIMLETVYKM